MSHIPSMKTEEFRARRPSDNMVFDDGENNGDKVFEALTPDRIDKQKSLKVP